MHNIYDFVIISCLIGNDFLPKIVSFYDVHDSLVEFLNIYKNYNKPLTTKKKIITLNLKEFFDIILNIYPFLNLLDTFL